jgi:hypothetical protein
MESPTTALTRRQRRLVPQRGRGRHRLILTLERRQPRTWLSKGLKLRQVSMARSIPPAAMGGGAAFPDAQRNLAGARP